MRCRDWPAHGRKHAKDALWLQSLPLVRPSLLPACLARQQLPYIYTAARPFQFRTLFATSGLVIITNKTHNSSISLLHSVFTHLRRDSAQIIVPCSIHSLIQVNCATKIRSARSVFVPLRSRSGSPSAPSQKKSSEVHNSVSITIHNTVPVVVGRDQ
ncbi:hypothetical protein BGZ57DRAFT_438233 [Hyaloscypha finlandica]|jgi:hypothetical protein|nr:hypothetical protein BGZ57DRAFT_438233 [Hyaloscypha finlandica]